MGRLDQAAADFKKALELSPDVDTQILSEIYLMQGRPQDALPEVERVHYAPLRAFGYALTYYELGRKKQSDAALSELVMKYHASNAFEIASVCAFRKQTDKAFEWLDRGYAQHDPSMMSTKVSPLLKSLHNDPRFAALLKKLNLPN